MCVEVGSCSSWPDSIEPTLSRLQLLTCSRARDECSHELIRHDDAGSFHELRRDLLLGNILAYPSLVQLRCAVPCIYYRPCAAPCEPQRTPSVEGEVAGPGGVGRARHALDARGRSERSLGPRRHTSACRNAISRARLNGEPPQSLSPYPLRFYKPLQTSVKCNGRSTDVTDVRYWYRLTFTEVLHLFGSRLNRGGGRKVLALCLGARTSAPLEGAERPSQSQTSE